MKANIKIVLISIIVILMTMVLAPFQYMAVKLDWKLCRKVPIFWHRVVLKLMGIRTIVHGEITRQRPLMIVANHISWMDIILLGSVGELCFIAKNEVDESPGSNFLARMQRTIFVVRENRKEVGRQAKEITERMLEGDPIVLFAEGTTGDGHRVLDFKSSLFGATHYATRHGNADKVFVQPIVLSYTKQHGMPLGYSGRTRAAWTGDMIMPPHIAFIIRNGPWDVEISIEEPIEIDQSTRRQTIAMMTREKIRQTFLKTTYGHEVD
ncbi:MAG: lysophospholipid acyltransferase family protein [Pseudomonadota bacterium]